MLSESNRMALKDKCKGFYPEIGRLVGPVPVSATFVGQVLRGQRSSENVEKAALAFIEDKEKESSEINKRAKKLITK